MGAIGRYAVTSDSKLDLLPRKPVGADPLPGGVGSVYLYCG